VCISAVAFRRARFVPSEAEASGRQILGREKSARFPAGRHSIQQFDRRVSPAEGYGLPAELHILLAANILYELSGPTAKWTNTCFSPSVRGRRSRPFGEQTRDEANRWKKMNRVKRHRRVDDFQSRGNPATGSKSGPCHEIDGEVQVREVFANLCWAFKPSMERPTFG